MKVHNPPTVAPGIGYSHGIELPPDARLLYLSGQIGTTTDGQMAPDIRSQAEQAWRNLGAVLESAGMGFANLVKVTHYLTRADDVPTYRAVRLQFLGAHAPASTLVIISALARVDALVEVEAIAAKA